MASIDNMMKRSRTAMIEESHDIANAEFTKRFGFRPGDFVTYKSNRDGGGLVKARILFCESCFYNARGGYTAYVKVLPLLVGGRLGNSRGMYFVVNANGGVVKPLNGNGTIEKFG